jgi:hypothetical protein
VGTSKISLPVHNVDQTRTMWATLGSANHWVLAA